MFSAVLFKCKMIGVIVDSSMKMLTHCVAMIKKAKLDAGNY